MQCEKIELAGADIRYYPKFFDSEQSEKYFTSLNNQIAWRQEKIKIFGQTHNIPRLQAWYGDSDATYAYSGLQLTPLPWIQSLLDIREQLQRITESKFNSVLCNLYRHEKDSNGWHADDERGLGKQPVIASVSFGATRKFQIRSKNDKSSKVSIDLQSGSLLLMQGWTQRDFQHQVPKSSKICQPRINLTYRLIAHS